MGEHPVVRISDLDAASSRAAANRRQGEMIDFAQQLIRTPSLPGEERAIAVLTGKEMERLGYDEVWTDRVGNVVGLLRGVGGGRSVQFNSHLDHVDVGDPNLWPHPPFAAKIDGDTLFGRGASDVKGAMATQVYLVPVLRDLGWRPPGDVYVAGVVLEEVGGLGSQVLAAEMPTHSVILGEATNNQLRRGDRGRALIRITFTGLSAHASAPDRARNPHFAVARFLLQLERLPMARDSTFGVSTAAPTLIESDQMSSNVTPATIAISLDWRSIPSETSESIVARVGVLAEEVAAKCDGISAKVEIVGREVTSYTGVTGTLPPTRGFETPFDHPVLVAARSALERTLGRPVTVDTWTFATDGGHFDRHGMTTIGFAPGEEKFAHTIHDQVSLAKMTEALTGNVALAIALAASEAAS
jgi:putative selenium metabolism hydrolase